MKIGILTDHGRVARWQADALRAIGEGNVFVVLDCVNSRAGRRRLTHALYYLLNLFTVRNRLTTSVPVPAELNVVDRVTFEAEADGAWQRLPDHFLANIAEHRPAVILKFGMGLLRVPTRETMACPILSYHHGDPRRFRGRPAGFYELLTGEPMMGQIVQILSNRLDAGRIVNFAESKVHAHSYRGTLIDAYRISPLLLKHAIDRALADRDLPMEAGGKNYRLPSNGTVLRFVAKLIAATGKRLVYGTFFEKVWRVAEAPVSPSASALDFASVSDDEQWRRWSTPSGYTFLADPFHAPDGNGLLAEAMRADGRGVIVRVTDGDADTLEIEGGHCSYPATVAWEGRRFIVPETSGWSAPRLFELAANGIVDGGPLRIAGEPRLLDPTLHAQGEAMFLFGNRLEEGDNVLRLWVADGLFDEFTEHPASPIRLSPAGARMGGLIVPHEGACYRVGQDFRRNYGDGVMLFRITELSRETYGEEEAGKLRFRNHRGPHTLNLKGSRVLFDYYDERFSLLAGWRRWRQRRADLAFLKDSSRGAAG